MKFSLPKLPKLVIPSFLKKRWFHFILIIVLILGGFFYWQHRQKVKDGIKTYQVVRQDLEQVVTASGTITAKDQVTLTFQTIGRLEWVGVKKGDYVQKWQAIASLNQVELEKNLKKKLLDYMDARWDVEQADDDYDIRGRPLDIVSLTDEEKRIYEQYRFAMDITILDVEIADLAKKYAYLVTPIEGVVIEATNEHAGINISTTSKYVIADPNSLRFTAEVEELDIGLISASLPAAITLDAFPDNNISSLTSSIEFTAVETVGGSTAYNVHFPLNYSNDYRLDMSGSVNIVITRKNNVLAVPIEAVTETEEGKEVTVKKGDKQEKVIIITGLEAEDYYEITQGLSEGEMIVLPQ